MASNALITNQLERDYSKYSKDEQIFFTHIDELMDVFDNAYDCTRKNNIGEFIEYVNQMIGICAKAVSDIPIEGNDQLIREISHIKDTVLIDTKKTFIEANEESGTINSRDIQRDFLRIKHFISTYKPPAYQIQLIPSKTKIRRD